MDLLATGRPVVQKYGGTSVGDVGRIQHVAERVARQYRQGLKRNQSPGGIGDRYQCPYLAAKL
jgi:hypothetical protein